MLRRIALASLVTLGLLTALYAETVPTYKKGQVQRYRSSIAVIDSAAVDGANVLALPTIDAGLNQVVILDLKMSVASATCKVHFVRSDGPIDAPWQRPTSKTSATATADGYFTIGGKYMADGLYFDTGSFRFFKILAEAPSSGTVDMDITICGARP